MKSSKEKSCWECIECGHSHPRWAGQCAQCRAWNTLQESVPLKEPTRRYSSQDSGVSAPLRLSEIPQQALSRLTTGFTEIDRLFGGGVVPGALTLVGGDPGIGKSTLLLQLCEALARQGHTVLYVCGEESLAQTSLRARRLGIGHDNLFLLHETEFNAIKQQVDRLKPSILVVDSIQIVYKGDLAAAPGSTVQVRENAAEYMHLSKSRNLTTFLIGHVTKSGEIAGPRLLEHLVDTVLYFEGDKQHHYRLVRAVKNRFGSTDEIALLLMGEEGLREVANPSQLFLEERTAGLVGAAVTTTLEGSRTLLVEVQALVTETPFSTPSRRCSGLDQNRLALLLAVLEKRLRYQLFRCDVFVAVAGGMRVAEPSIDLALLCAVASSLRNKPIDGATALIGEVGLGGEVRAVQRVESRVKECAQLGFKKVILPAKSLRSLKKELTRDIACVGVASAEEAVHVVLD